MAKVLVVRKPDRTVHVVPLNNKAYFQSQNNRLPAEKRVKLEVMEEKEAHALPFIDDNYVSPSVAQDQLKEAKSTLAQKDSRIAELEAKLAAMEGKGQSAASGDDSSKLTAVQIIDQIAKEENVDIIRALLDGETRKTVIDAANKRIAELESK